MKKLRILSIALILTLFMGALVGCGDVEVSSLYNNRKVKEIYSREKILTKAEKLSFEDEVVNSLNEILVLKNSTETQEMWTFYNVSSKKVVYTETKNLGEIIEVNFARNGYGDYVFYIVSSYKDSGESTCYKISVHDKNGNLIRHFISNDLNKVNQMIPKYNLDVLTIGNEFYRQNRKDVYKLFTTVASSKKIPTFYAKSDDFYYAVTDSIIVFDKNLDIVGTYKAPSYAQVKTFSILNNGKVLIQYELELKYDDDDYDYIYDSVPIKIESKLINFKKDKIKDVNLDYFVEIASRDTIYSGKSLFDFNTLNKSIENVGFAYKIEDERLDTVPIIVSTNNNGKIKECFDNIMEGQREVNYMTNDFGIPSIICGDRYEINNVIGQTFLLDGKGRIIGDITNQKYKNGKYIIIDDIIYDMNLAQVASCAGYELVTEFGKLQTSIVFKKAVDASVQYYLFTDGEFKSLANQSVSKIITTNNNYIVVRNDVTGLYTIYNENLEELVSTTAQLGFKLSCHEHGVVFSGYNEQMLKHETYLLYSAK